MKITTLIFIIISCTSLKGQTLDYFEYNPSWKTHSSVSITSCVSFTDTQIKLEGDTVLENGVAYKKFRSTSRYWQYDVGGFEGDCDGPTTYLTGLGPFLRQSGDSIFQYLTSSDEEVLALHFNFNVGDTLQGAHYFSLFDDDSPIVVTHIDSLETALGFHRRFSISAENIELGQMIEGIGHPWGFLNLVGVVLNGGSSLSCYKQNDEYVYGEDIFCSDISYSSSVDELFRKELLIYPNPISNNEFTIDNLNISNLKNFDIRITSLDGTVLEIFDKRIETSDKVVIELNNPTSGFYLVEIFSDELSIKKKVVIE